MYNEQVRPGVFKWFQTLQPCVSVAILGSVHFGIWRLRVVHLAMLRLGGEQNRGWRIPMALMRAKHGKLIYRALFESKHQKVIGIQYTPPI